MKKNVLKLNCLGIFLFCLLIPFEVAAEALKTTSGKIFHDYKITRFLQDGVLVSHSQGICRLRYDELPPNINQQYSKEISYQKGLYNRRLEPVIKRMISRALKAAAPSEKISQLEDIRKRYPTHSLIAEVDKLLQKISQERNVFQVLHANITYENSEEQISELKKLLKNTSAPELIKKINLVLEDKKTFLNDFAAEIDCAIIAATGQKNPEKAIEELKNILKTYPKYPWSTRQKSYIDRVNKLIAEKQNLLKTDKQKKNNQLAICTQQKSLTGSQLEKMLLSEPKYDMTLSQKIFFDSIGLDKAIKAACSQSPRIGITMLDQALKNAEFAINKEEALRSRNKLKVQLR